MRSKLKKALAVLASAAMCGSMLLNFPSDTFEISLPVFAADEAETSVTDTATIDLSQYSAGATVDITENCQIIGDGTEFNVTLNIAADATVIFEVGTSGVKLGGSINVADGKTLTLLVKGNAEHTVKDGISLGNSANVIIEGDLTQENNKLTVTSSGGNAGIGANGGVTAGDITIRNARVDATGSTSDSSQYYMSGAGIGTANASMGNILIENSIVTAAGGYYFSSSSSDPTSHAAAIGMGSSCVTMGNITLIDSEITASNNGDGHASVIGAGSFYHPTATNDNIETVGNMGNIIITSTELNLSMAKGSNWFYAAMIGPGLGNSAYSCVNMGKIIFTDVTQAELDEMIATWSIPSDFNQYGAYVLGRGRDGSYYDTGDFDGVWVSDGNGDTVQIGDESGYYEECTNTLLHTYDNLCDGECNVCGITRLVVHTEGTAATCTAQAVCAVCGVSYGDKDAEAHSGGEATCTTLAVCSGCAANYGEVDPDNHTGALSTYAPTADGSQHAATWSCCNKVEAAAHSFDETTGFCNVCGAVITASLTNGETVTYYETLAEAVTAAQSASGSTVQLLDSVTLSNTIYITTGQFTIDLNGKTVTSASGCDAFDLTLYDPTVEGANVTIISTVSGGKIESSDGYRSVYVGYGTAKVIGVELNTAMAASTLTLENVKITAADTGILAESTGNITILGNSSISGDMYDVYCGTSATITLGEGVTFPDGLTAISSSDSKALNTMLADGMAYWQGDNKMLQLASDTYEITGGTVTVKAVCTHEGGTQTYAPIEGGTQHTATYSCCGTTVTEAHSGGTATCLGYQCVVCGAWYGDVDANNHASDEFTYTANTDGTTHTKKYKCCDAVASANEEHTITTWTHDNGWHTGNCDHCGASLYGLCEHNMDSTTGKCTVCDTLIAYFSVTSGETVTYYRYVLGEDATVLKSGDTVKLLADVGDYFNAIIPEGVTFDGGNFTLNLNDYTLENNGTIAGGTFTDTRVENNGTIEGGTFNDEVSNHGTIEGGTFDTICIEDGSISGNVKITSYLDFRNNYTGDSIIDLSNADLGDEISLLYNSEYRDEIPVYGDVLTIPDGYCVFMHPYTYTETINSETASYIIRKHSHTLDGYGYDGDSHWKTCSCGYADETTEAHTPTYVANDNVNTITYGCECGNGEVIFTLNIPTATYGDSPIGAPHYTCSDTTYAGEFPVITIDGEENNYPTNAGTYEAVMTWGEVSVSGEYVIAKAVASVATASTANELIYNGEAQALVSAGEAVGGTMMYALSEDGEYSTEIPTGTNAGSD